MVGEIFCINEKSAKNAYLKNIVVWLQLFVFWGVYGVA